MRFHETTCRHRRQAECGEIHAVQQAGGPAAVHRGGYPRRHPGPAVRRGRVAQQEVRPGGHRRHRAGDGQRDPQLHAPAGRDRHRQRHGHRLPLRHQDRPHRLGPGGGQHAPPLGQAGGAGGEQDGPGGPGQSGHLRVLQPGSGGPHPGVRRPRPRHRGPAGRVLPLLPARGRERGARRRDQGGGHRQAQRGQVQPGQPHPGGGAGHRLQRGRHHPGRGGQLL